MSIKIDRLNNLFIEEISKILRTEIKDERINFVTVTSVNITSDLYYAKVYVTVLDDSKRNEIIKLLNKGFCLFCNPSGQQTYYIIVTVNIYNIIYIHIYYTYI